jgi:hypothetical protein
MPVGSRIGGFWRRLTDCIRRLFAKSFQGMHLPREVIDKLYRRNAQSMFTAACRFASSKRHIEGKSRIFEAHPA